MPKKIIRFKRAALIEDGADGSYYVAVVFSDGEKHKNVYFLEQVSFSSIWGHLHRFETADAIYVQV